MTNIFSNRLAQGVAAIVAIAAIFVGYNTISGDDTNTPAANTEASTTTTNVTTVNTDNDNVEGNTTEGVTTEETVEGTVNTISTEGDNTTDATNTVAE